MNIQISNASNEPIYLQIKNQIKGEIISGKLKSFDKLPSIRFLAKELRVSVITTKRAYDELEIEGFINSVQGKGSFVSEQNKELIKEEQYKKIESLIEEAFEEAKLVGLSKKDLINIIESFEGE